MLLKQYFDFNNTFNADKYHLMHLTSIKHQYLDNLIIFII
jgi:hypothetical protein